MKKLISMLAVIGLTASTTASVMACSLTPKNNEPEKQDLTVELWNEFTQDLVLSYEGPFVFEQGQPLENVRATGMLFYNTLNDLLYQEANKKFNYSEWEMSVTSPAESNGFIINENILVGELMEFELEVMLRHPSDSSMNRRKIKIKFKQTEQLKGVDFLEKMYLISVLPHKNTQNQSRGYSRALMRTQYEIYTEGVLPKESEWNSLNDDEKNDFVTEHLKSTFNMNSPKSELTDKLEFQVTKVSYVDLIEYTFNTGNEIVEISNKRYEIEMKLFLKNDTSTFITKTFYHKGYST